MAFVSFLTSLADVSATQWGTAAVIVLASWLAGKAVYWFFKRIARQLTAKTKMEFDDQVIDAIEEPVAAAVLLAGAWYAFQILNVSDEPTIGLFYNALKIAGTAIAAWGAFRLVNPFAQHVLVPVSRKANQQVNELVVPLVSKTLKIIIALLTLLFILDNVGFDVTALLAGAGLGGLAIAFAAQQTISNIFGGISIIVDKTFSVGDRIRLDSGEEGTVKEITLRTTRVLTQENELVIVPNATLANSKIVNYSQPDSGFRAKVDFGVVYGSKPETVRKVALRAVQGVDGIEFNDEKRKPSVVMEGMGDFAVQYRLFFWVQNALDTPSKQREVRERLYDKLNENRIGIPFPTHTVYLQPAGKENRKKA